MNQNNYNFSNQENILEFEMGRDYLKEMECTDKSNEIFFSFPEQSMFNEEFRFEEAQSPRNLDFSEDLFAFESQKSEFESLKCLNVNISKVEEVISNASSSDKTKAKSKTKSDTQLSLAFSNDGDYCKKIDTFSEDECNIESNPKFAEGDMNIFVEKLLNSNAVDYLKDQGIEVDDKTAKLLTVNKRRRKTKAQISQLDAEYKLNPDWTKSFMQTLGERLRISPSSIYKWHWDQKHKHEKPCNIKDRKVRLSSTIYKHE